MFYTTIIGHYYIERQKRIHHLDYKLININLNYSIIAMVMGIDLILCSSMNDKFTRYAICLYKMNFAINDIPEKFSCQRIIMKTARKLSA